MLIDRLLQFLEDILFCIFSFLPLILSCFIHLRLLYLFITRFSAKDISQYFDQSSPIVFNPSNFSEQPRVSLIDRFKLSKSVFKNLGHVIGMVGIIAIAAYTWQSSPAVTGSLKPAVRALAYIADFQQAPMYPGVEVNKRLRLHENGVVSYAEERGGDIIISVEKVP
jgi:hypothetical protein